VAGGTGAAATRLAAHYGCPVLLVDLEPRFLRDARARAHAAGVGGLVAPLRADGLRLPLPTATGAAGADATSGGGVDATSGGGVDATLCLGAASLLGLPAILGELARVTRPGGVVVVSDIVWRRTPAFPLGPEWGWVGQIRPRYTLDEYVGALARAGLTVEGTRVHPDADWQAYFDPLLDTAIEGRVVGDAEAIHFAETIEAMVRLERAAHDEFLDYVTFVTRRSAARARPGHAANMT